MAAQHINEARKAQAAVDLANNMKEVNAKLDLIMEALKIEYKPAESVLQAVPVAAPVSESADGLQAADAAIPSAAAPQDAESGKGNKKK